jgi:hypothetical protein
VEAQGASSDVSDSGLRAEMMQDQEALDSSVALEGEERTNEAGVGGYFRVPSLAQECRPVLSQPQYLNFSRRAPAPIGDFFVSPTYGSCTLQVLRFQRAQLNQRSTVNGHI